jgi:hypothetical protein
MVVETHFLFSFLVENPGDNESLNRYLNQEKLNQITLIRISNQHQNSNLNQLPIPDLSSEGYSKYLDPISTAPFMFK